MKVRVHQIQAGDKLVHNPDMPILDGFVGYPVSEIHRSSKNFRPSVLICFDGLNTPIRLHPSVEMEITR